jgi:hypothetical protein
MIYNRTKIVRANSATTIGGAATTREPHCEGAANAREGGGSRGSMGSMGSIREARRQAFGGEEGGLSCIRGGGWGAWGAFGGGEQGLSCIREKAGEHGEHLGRGAGATIPGGGAGAL